jgi:acyl-CoA synthetase (NDP forming)
MAGGESIWHALYRQTGAVRVGSLEEMAQTTMLFTKLKPAAGKRVAILGTGGGVSVAAADTCARTGLELPPFENGVLKELRAHIPPAGNMIRNPIDAEILFYDLKQVEQILKLLNNQSSIDMIILALHLDWFMEIGEGKHVVDLAAFLGAFVKNPGTSKPLVVAWRSYSRSLKDKQIINAFEDKLIEVDVPVFEGLNSAARALSLWADYHRFRNECRHHA